MDQGGDALRLFGRDGAREDVCREQEGLRVRQLVCGAVALAKEDGGEAQPAAQGFLDEVLAFDGDEAGRIPFWRPAGARESGAQLLDARVVAAFDAAQL